ncbi:MAG: hypothetical protein ACPG7F_18100 [Aggregatilineales bacterium]
MNIISIRLDEIRLTEKAINRNIPVDSVWMIPLNTTTEQGMGARFQYVEEGQSFIIRENQSYMPSSPWFLSVEKDDLNQQDFGMWFMISAFNNQDEQEQLRLVVEDIIPMAGAGILTALLAPVTPGLPDEIIPAKVTASRGVALMGRIAALGKSVEGVLSNQPAREFAGSIAGGLAETTLQSLSISLASSANIISETSYFGEVYITFPASEDYRLNNRVSVVTTDGSLILEFSIFETSNVNDTSYVSSSPVEAYLPVEDCNPEAPGTIQSGKSAQVLRQMEVSASPIDTTASMLFRLSAEDIITPVIPYCDTQKNILWWRVRDENGQQGWLPESRGITVFMESLQ